MVKNKAEFSTPLSSKTALETAYRPMFHAYLQMG